MPFAILGGWIIDLCLTAKDFYWHWIIKGELHDH
jgi:hypothetical protein